ncbi:MAG: IS3 family transposase, partial [Nitrospirota bacterium]
KISESSKYSYGSRRMKNALNALGYPVGRRKIRRLMKEETILVRYRKKYKVTTNSNHKQPVYENVLNRQFQPAMANQAYASDITYIKHKGSFMYLSAIIDLYSRKILSWKLSNTMDISICTDVLNEALVNYGVPEIFNTDQGSQYTSRAFTGILINKGVRISMDGKGRCLDNIFIERFWRSLKYENIFIHDYKSVTELKYGISKYMQFYNTERFHQSLEYKTPDEVYYEDQKTGSIAINQLTIIEEKSRMKTTQKPEKEVRNGLCQNLTSFFESMKGSFTHIKHQKAVQSKGLTLLL